MGRAASVAWMLMPQGGLPSNRLGLGTSLTLPPYAAQELLDRGW